MIPPTSGDMTGKGKGQEFRLVSGDKWRSLVGLVYFVCWARLAQLSIQLMRTGVVSSSSPRQRWRWRRAWARRISPMPRVTHDFIDDLGSSDRVEPL